LSWAGLGWGSKTRSTVFIC